MVTVLLVVKINESIDSQRIRVTTNTFKVSRKLERRY
nr:MAG TPA: hypothetical protein [Caudoviricetes sp.]